MKYSTNAAFIIWIAFTINCFAQDKIFKEESSRKFTSEKLKETQNPNDDVFQRINDIKSLSQKSPKNIWQTELKNPKREFYEVEGFNAKDTRTTINKTLLENGSQLIEEIEQNWDSTNSVWVNYSKDSYVYDVNNNETEWLHQNWGGSNWVNYTKYSYAYDVDNKKVEEINQFWLSTISEWKYTRKYSYAYDVNYNQIEEVWYNWDNSDWVNYYKILHTYDENSILTDLLRQYWLDSIWVNREIYKITYTYDVNNNPIEETWLTWSDSVWSNSNMSLYTYDVNNNQTEWIRQFWIGSAWVNYEKYSHTYDVNNNLTEYIYQYWNNYDSVWYSYYKYLYTYDGNNNLIEEIFQNGDGSNINKYSNNYDGNNNKIESFYYNWDGSAWLKGGRAFYTYDGSNNRIEELRQSWDGSDWVNTRKLIYSYMPTDVKEFTNEFNDYSLSNNYPNPFNPTTTIKYQIAERNIVSIKVYDILGNEIKTLVGGEMSPGKYEVSFDASGLSSGIYFYQIKAGDFNQTRKMILLK